LGGNLKKEQVQQLFDQSVEHMTNSLNKILKSKFIDPVESNPLQTFAVPTGQGKSGVSSTGGLLQ
jgi:hypothetical protein